MVQQPSTSHPVIIVGAGFGGLSTAIYLRRLNPKLTIMLIEPNSEFIFFPLLFEFLSEEVKKWEICPAYNSLLSALGIVYVEDLVVEIDVVNECITTESGLIEKYSQLVIATGLNQSDYNIKGVKENAFMFRTPADAMRLKEYIEELNMNEEKLGQDVVIVGAGATGVELACKIADLVHPTIKLHLIDSDDRILPRSKSFNRDQAEFALAQKGIQIHLQTQVIAITADQVHLESLENGKSRKFSLPQMCLVWVAGLKSNSPDVLPTKIVIGRRLPIDRYLRVSGMTNVFAIGDISSHLENAWPSNAQVAMQQAQVVAKNVMANLRGNDLELFECSDLGEMLSLGIGKATITAFGLTLAGSLAFQLRRMIYLARFPDCFLGMRSAGAWLLGN